MFADESARPEGLHYQPDFISVQEEAALIGHIRALPLAPFQFGIYEGKGRVVFFGWRYDFTLEAVEELQRLEAVEELPAWLVPMAGRVERFAALPSGSIKHALCTSMMSAPASAGTATKSTSIRYSGSPSPRPAISVSAAKPTTSGSVSRSTRSHARSTCVSSRATAAMISSAARTVRSASSSCALA
jgi:hypothetical protein